MGRRSLLPLLRRRGRNSFQDFGEFFHILITVDPAEPALGRGVSRGVSRGRGAEGSARGRGVRAEAGRGRGVKAEGSGRGVSPAEGSARDL